MNKGERIKILLETIGWSQTALAKKVGVSRQTVGDWIKGKAVPYPSNLEKISEATGCSQTWLASGKGEMLPPTTWTEKLQDRILPLLGNWARKEAPDVLVPMSKEEYGEYMASQELKKREKDQPKRGRKPRR